MKDEKKMRNSLKIASILGVVVIIILVILEKPHNININFIEDCRVDLLVCQITGTLLIISVGSVLGNRGKATYWTDTMKQVFEEPEYFGIRALTDYSFSVMVISIVAFGFKSNNVLFVSFIISNVILVCITYKLISVYYGKQKIKLKLQIEFANVQKEIIVGEEQIEEKKKDIKGEIEQQKKKDIERKIEQQKKKNEENKRKLNNYINKLVENTLKALQDDDSDVFVENMIFLWENNRKREFKYFLKEVGKHELCYVNLLEIFLLKEEKILKNEDDEIRRENYSIIYRIVLSDKWSEAGYALVGQYFMKLFDSIIYDEDSGVSNCSFAALQVKELLINKNYQMVSAIGEVIWETPNIINANFGYTIAKFCDVKEIQKHCSEENCIKGFYYALYYTKYMADIRKRKDCNAGMRGEWECNECITLMDERMSDFSSFFYERHYINESVYGNENLFDEDCDNRIDKTINDSFILDQEGMKNTWYAQGGNTTGKRY